MKKRDFKDLTISSQLILAFLAVITLSVLIVTFVFSRNSFHTIREDSLENFSLNNRQITSNLNETLSMIDRYYTFVHANRVIYNGLQEEGFGETSESYEAVVLFKDLLFSFISVTDGIESAFYISRKGIVVSYLSGTVNPEFVGSGEFLELPFIGELREDPTKKIWYLPEDDQANDTVFYIRGVFNPRNREVMGFISFILHRDIFAKQINGLTGGKTDFFICDKTGKLIASSEANQDRLPAELMNQINSNPHLTTWRYRDKYYFVEEASNSWFVISRLDVSDLIDMKRLLLLGTLTFLLSVIPGLFISIFFSRRYSRDFKFLIDSMRESEQGYIVHITDQGSNVEARAMASQYNEMMENIAELTASLRQEIEDKNRAEEERTKLESQLRQSQKMEAVGQLAGGIAHDFNNLLTALFGYVDLGKLSVEGQLGTDNDIYDQFSEIDNLAQRAASLTRQLLTFSRKDMVQLKNLDLNEIIQNMSDMLSRLIKENIQLKIIPGKDLSLIRADPGHMEQILVNLVVNSVHAMPDGGNIIIETFPMELSEEYAQSHADASPGPYTVLCVSDTGTGMSKETIEKIFEPFFTTKFREKGTGLGLATVHGIVKQSGGYISVYSEEGIGTTFRLFFPALAILANKADSSNKEPKTSKNPEALGGTETILLCEDNESVRKLIEESLRSAGYKVISYEDGREALDGARNLDEKIDLLVSDVIIPGLNGQQLSTELTKIYPGLPVLYISGYTYNVIARHGVLEPGTNLLEKPFSREKLLRTIREILKT
ncbi:MAG: ATP-binding protein [Spirochaetales bacterium]|nr:ATP-binding protein [Spirochaetales bacterium]